jgi:hypothetical protein
LSKKVEAGEKGYPIARQRQTGDRSYVYIINIIETKSTIDSTIKSISYKQHKRLFNKESIACEIYVYQSEIVFNIVNHLTLVVKSRIFNW